LRQILKRTVVVYQDDYYKVGNSKKRPSPFAHNTDFIHQLELHVPVDEASQLANWDCPESVDFNKFAENIHYARNNEGRLPEGFTSNEESNVHDGSSLLSIEAVNALNQILAPFVNDPDAIFVFVDGFMLYWNDQVSQQLDCKITITASYETLKSRREKRQGYHTLEGYWVDPPGYFDKIVWPEYLRMNEHNATIKDVLIINTDENSIDETAIKVASKVQDRLL
jgi:nicotinamide/nicotinate riboside kinase